jgi:hypothetical protein
MEADLILADALYMTQDQALDLSIVIRDVIGEVQESQQPGFVLIGEPGGGAYFTIRIKPDKK